jgi:hypothetical protein
MHDVISKIKKWCDENNFIESNSSGVNNNFYYIHKDGQTEQIDVYWGTTNKQLNRKYNLCFEINTQSTMVTYQLIDLSDDAYDNQYGDSTTFSHNDYIMGESFYLKDIEENISGLRNYITNMFNLTTFPVLYEED